MAINRFFKLTDDGGSLLLSQYFLSTAKTQLKVLFVTNKISAVANTGVNYNKSIESIDNLLYEDLTLHELHATLPAGANNLASPTLVTKGSSELTTTIKWNSITLSFDSPTGNMLQTINYIVVADANNKLFWVEKLFIDSDSDGTAEADSFTPAAGGKSTLTITPKFKIGTQADAGII
jgi:hypothetical protein